MPGTETRQRKLMSHITPMIHFCLRTQRKCYGNVTAVAQKLPQVIVEYSGTWNDIRAVSVFVTRKSMPMHI